MKLALIKSVLFENGLFILRPIILTPFSRIICLLLILGSSAFGNDRKIRIGVTDFKNKTEQSDASWITRYYDGVASVTKLSNGDFSTVLTTALVKTRRFELIERANLDLVLKEQGLSVAKVINEDTGAISGKIKGIDFILVGSITKADFSATPQKLGNHRITKVNFEFAVDFKLVDVVTGSIVLGDFIEVKETASENINGGTYDLNSGTNTFAETAMRKASLQAAFLIANAIEPLRVDEINASKGLVKLNYGNGFIEKDQHYRIYASSDSWDSSPDETGIIKITSVSEKFAVGKIVQGNAEDFSSGCKLEKFSIKEEEKIQQEEERDKRGRLGGEFGYL